MKKKIIIGVFSLLILITAIFFIVGAIESYNREVASEDILEGFGAAMIMNTLDVAVSQGSWFGWLGFLSVFKTIPIDKLAKMAFYAALWGASSSFIKEE